MQLLDNHARYGSLSRLLHWGMAIVLGWQFVTVLARVLAEKSALDNFMWATHKPVGLILMVLVVIRLLWALLSLARRPASISVMAKLGHWAMYACMVIVPLVALLRQYGSGREFVAFGYTVMPGFSGPKIDWMVNLAGLLHGNLGWALLVLIAGHVLMAFMHRGQGEKNVLPRMIGR